MAVSWPPDSVNVAQGVGSLSEVVVSVPVTAAWGKAGSGSVPHPLVCHMIDTVAVAEQLYDVYLGPTMRRELETGLGPLGHVPSWVAVLCGLHDLGKCSPVFQAKRLDLAVASFGDQVKGELERLVSAAQKGRVDIKHGDFTTVYFRDALRRWGATADVTAAIAHGIGGHHGNLIASDKYLAAKDRRGHYGGHRWDQWRDDLVTALIQLWSLGEPAEANWAETSLDVATAAVGLIALTSVSDWIASDDTKFPYAGFPVDDLEAYRESAREKAQDVVGRRLRWRKWRPPEDTRFRQLFPAIHDPRPLHLAVESLVAEQDSAGVLVIEAPTGEGKTKAGVQAMATLVRRLDLSGGYIALPTRATANGMHSELSDAAHDLGMEYSPKLVYSTAVKELDDARLDPSEVGLDDDAPMHVEKEFFTRRRGLLFPVGIGTWDQSLQASIMSRHVYVRLAGLSSKVLLVDEVHALDTYSSTLLYRLMWWCGRLGIPVILLSATLPADRRAELIAQWKAGSQRLLPNEVEASRVQVPGGWQVTWAGTVGEPVSRPIAISDVNADREVEVDHLADDELTTWLEKRIGQGGCALVICNLVGRVEDMYTRIEQAIADWEKPPTLVYLTRMTSEGQRTDIERWLRESFGETSEQRPHAIVVGTQILEHSLDIDFDLLVSDLCPIDVLIQRVGRVHRHHRPPEVRGCQVPTLGLLEPPIGKNGPSFPRGLHVVYPHEPLLRTWQELRDVSSLRLPSQTSKLVHDVYVASKPAPEGLERRFDQAAKTYSKQQERDEAYARHYYIPPLRCDDSITRLTEQPMNPGRTRRDRRDRRDGS
ncbi:CRISPR-associated helicase Cas3' [Actinobacteria bacterium YIM 96077]|uniref:CRISPR-associated helicase/endonuclease Cas3 n=1 Tax=Phytoactinopolyspora halophila TaxID=1981511 RepID=A0A329QBU6_9ACTN|nr:CRISPR-associated helicase Cas3' [Phytoactinopolyspora halophila]AYY13730.1 CRISPR-associated helicase Cas3' [Actinobacteria bacterium YIM 96077]RAW09461.1 hypothetical protein DPM12_21000 [Phytoactinopolyspora halophila]